MRTRLAAIAAVIPLMLSACTSDTSSPAPEPSGPSTTGGPTSTSSPTPVTTLADGTTLPEGCSGGVKDSQTVAFFAEGRTWSLNPATGVVACLFETPEPGPFAWGPLGDRAVLGEAAILGVGGVVPPASLKTVPTSLDWGHPIGIAIVYANEGTGVPLKYFLEDDRTAKLSELPEAEYRQVIYHPSGMGLAFILEDEEGPSIWLSTNEGADPQRLVFSASGTVFTSIAFTPDGRSLIYTADHGDYAAIHTMDLTDRSTFSTDWREEDQEASGLRISPDGEGMAFTSGVACEEHQARYVTGIDTALTLVDDGRPSEALGWLDPETILVGVGGCGEPLDLYARDIHLDDSEAVLLVSGVMSGASRAKAPPGPDFVPAPPEEPEFPDGVG